MRAHVVSQAGGPEVINLVELPVPEAPPGWVLIEVYAFGLNRSEMFTRQGHSPSVKFPRVLGIECVGVVVAAPCAEFSVGQRVAALMGGMGREFDGGYAEYTCVPATCVFPIDMGIELDWATLGATPEMFQTAWGALAQGLALAAGNTLLIRGGTSSVGMLAAQLALSLGARVLATTRDPEKAPALHAIGVEDVIIDDGNIASAVRAHAPDGADRVLELIGTTTLRDSLKACRAGGTVCMAGILGNSWQLDQFLPMADIPHTVRLTTYSGGTNDMDVDAYQHFLRQLCDGEISPAIDRVFAFEELAPAHAYMESNQARGKLVVIVRD